MKKYAPAMFMSLLALLFLPSIALADYYMFKITCTDGGITRSSLWMDERISNTVTIESRTYLSCDIVTLQLQDIEGAFHLSIDDLKTRVNLWREQAPRDGDKNSPIGWIELSSYGNPDFVHHNPVNHSWRRLYWDQKWDENYWIVNYGHRGSDFRRVKISFRDHDDRMHWFYVVPWAEE